MKRTTYIFVFIIFVVIADFFIGTYLKPQAFDCADIENRTLRLREVTDLGESTLIATEITIDGYLISGYSSENGKYGLAIFEPKEDETYEFSGNYSVESDQVLFGNTTINGKQYDLFWANQADLEYAEITYSNSGEPAEPLKLDATGNQIVYNEAPSNDYSVAYAFVDMNGNRYE